jgi:hypothetical protein
MYVVSLTQAWLGEPGLQRPARALQGTGRAWPAPVVWTNLRRDNARSRSRPCGPRDLAERPWLA